MRKNYSFRLLFLYNFAQEIAPSKNAHEIFLQAQPDKIKFKDKFLAHSVCYYICYYIRHSCILVCSIRHSCILVCCIRHSCILVIPEEIFSGRNEKASHGATNHKKTGFQKNNLM